MFCNNSGDLLLLFLFPSHAGGGFCRIPSSTAPSSVHPAQPGGFSGFSWWQVKRSCVLQLGGGFLEVFGSFLSCRVFRFPPPHSPCHRPLSKGTWFFSLFFSPEPCILEAALPPAPAPSAPFPWSVPFFPLVSLWSAWDGLCLPGGEWFNSEPCLWLPSPVSRGLLPLLDPRSPGGSGDGHFSCLPTVMSNFGCPLRSQFLCDFTFPSLLLRVVSQGYLKGKAALSSAAPGSAVHLGLHCSLYLPSPVPRSTFVGWECT